MPMNLDAKMCTIHDNNWLATKQRRKLTFGVFAVRDNVYVCDLRGPLGHLTKVNAGPAEC